MIVERLTFQAKYGRGDELVALMKEYASITSTSVRGRVYTDVTGAMFTVQVEIEHADMAAIAATDAQQRKEFGTTAFQQWFARMTELTERGERQLLNVETLP